MMKKGITGKILTIIISLVIGILALALLWFFLSEGTEITIEAAKKAVDGLKCRLLCHEILGKDIGMCVGC